MFSMRTACSTIINLKQALLTLTQRHCWIQAKGIQTGISPSPLISEEGERTILFHYTKYYRVSVDRCDTSQQFCFAAWDIFKSDLPFMGCCRPRRLEDRERDGWEGGWLGPCFTRHYWHGEILPTPTTNTSASPLFFLFIPQTVNNIAIRPYTCAVNVRKGLDSLLGEMETTGWSHQLPERQY